MIVMTSALLCTISYSQETIKELGERIELAAKARSAKDLKALRFTKGEPKDLSEAMDAMFALFEKKNLEASRPTIRTTNNHAPEMELPGSFQGKELEYLITPTHWIVISLSSKEGEQPKSDFKITLPAVKVEDAWRIPGIKYK